MITQLIEMTVEISFDLYQSIRDEHLKLVVVSNQILSGSKITLSSYNQVVFSECEFYACEFQGVTFENCVFENCNFKFSHIRNCTFKNCNFTNCEWSATSTSTTEYLECNKEADFQEYLLAS